NVNKLKWEQFYWDVFLHVRIQHQLFLVKVKNPSEELNENIFFQEHKYTIKCKKGFVLHPYIANNFSLVLFYKENSLYEDFWTRMKSAIAYKVYERFKKQFDQKEIWLIYEKFSRTAQDNSYFFFRYMYETHPEENVYYIIDKKSPEYKNVGYIMKKTGSNGADLFATTADWETEIIHHYFGYPYENIISTGLCRWDALIDKSRENNKREILLMPTWRNWLEDVSDETFMESDYYLQYMELLQSKKLNKLLVEHDLILNFNIHPKFLPYISKFQINSKHIKVFQFGEARINELLMRSSLLITDYSSVAWDFYYLKKPVAFFQFDYATYEELQGSYIDLKKDLFGERFTDADKLIEGIKAYIAKDFKLDVKYKEIW